MGIRQLRLVHKELIHVKAHTRVYKTGEVKVSAFDRRKSYLKMKKVHKPI